MGKRVRVAVVGVGNIGNVHARVYKGMDDVELVAVCDIIREKADKAAADYGARAFYSVAEMLKAKPGLDAASVATAGVENGGDHCKPTLELLEAGVPVLGEKPISNNLDEARRMVETARRQKLPYGVNLNHRFTPSAVRAKEWQEAGRLGEINMIQFKLWINNPNETAEYFHMRALHPHSIDVMRYFCGDVSRVHAFFKKGEGRKTWSNVQVNLMFRSGVIGHLVGSYDAGGSYGLESCEVVGSKGRFVILEACEKLSFYPRFSNEVETYEHLGGMQSFPDTFGTRIRAWVDDLKAGVSPDRVNASGEDALRAQTVIEAAIQSWQENRAVDV